MRDSMYSAVFGAMSNEFELDRITNNLANVNTTGYKKDKVAFHDTFIRFAHDHLVDARPYLRDKDLWPKPDVLAKPRLSEQYTDFEGGSLKETGNRLDFGLNGDGFFKVRTDEGEFLTRNGNFRLTPEGTLVTQQGFEVLGQGGPITLPRATDVAVDGNGMIRVNGEVVDQMQLVTSSDLRALEKIGSNLYRFGDHIPAQEVPATEVIVEQGYLETSNVNVVTEMVNMLEAQHAFSMYSKMMQGTDKLEQTLTNKIGRAIV